MFTKTIRHRLFAPIVVSLVFALLYANISLLNHYFFRTYALDLGASINAMYDYSQLRVNDNPVFTPRHSNFLGDHFALYPALFSPLRYLFGTYTLLIIQIAFLVAGGWGVYLFACGRSSDSGNKSLWAMLHFYVIWGVYSALSYDYHDNVISAAVVPFMFYFLDKQKWTFLWICWVFFLIGKENMALWGFFLAAGMCFVPGVSSVGRKHLIGMAFTSIVFFILVTKVVMPLWLDEGQTYMQVVWYGHKGDTMEEVYWHILTHPVESIRHLFENHTNNSSYDGIKLETWYYFLFSGGIFFFRYPAFWLMVLPIFGQKMMSVNVLTWGITAQYSIEFVPLLAICTWLFFQKTPRVPHSLYIVFVLLCGFVTYQSMIGKKSLNFSISSANPFVPEHYTNEFNTAKVYRYLEQIPDSAAVSAQCQLYPHLAERQDIYQYPDIQNSDYIALLKTPSTYPLRKEDYDKRLDSLLTDSVFSILINDSPFYLFKRR